MLVDNVWVLHEVLPNGSTSNIKECRNEWNFHPAEHIYHKNRFGLITSVRLKSLTSSIGKLISFSNPN